MLRRLFPGVYEGWLVVGSAAFIVTLVAASFFYGFGTIFTPILDEFGWSVAATSFAFSLRSEVGGLAAPLVGMTIDRLGPRRVLFFGVAVTALGVLLMSFMHNIWQFYATMMLIAVGTSSAGGQVGLAAISTWFDARRARAMSLMTVGGGVSGLFVVAVAALVEAAGWRGALRVMALIMLAAGSLAAINVRARPAAHPQPMDGVARAAGNDDPVTASRWGVPVRRAVRTRAFALLALSFVGTGFATTAIIVHQIPFLESIGVSKQAAGGTVALFTLTSIVGRLGFGYLADIYDKRVVLAVPMALTAAGIPMLALVDSLWQAALVLAIIAPGFGGTIPVRPALLADYFGTRYFGTMNGIMSLAMTTGAFFGPLTVGWIVDVTGEYTMGWMISGVVAALAIPAVLAARRPAALEAMRES